MNNYKRFSIILFSTFCYCSCDSKPDYSDVIKELEKREQNITEENKKIATAKSELDKKNQQLTASIKELELEQQSQHNTLKNNQQRQDRLLEKVDQKLNNVSKKEDNLQKKINLILKQKELAENKLKIAEKLRTDAEYKLNQAQALKNQTNNHLAIQQENKVLKDQNYILNKKNTILRADIVALEISIDKWKNHKQAPDKNYKQLVYNYNNLNNRHKETLSNYDIEKRNHFQLKERYKNLLKLKNIKPHNAANELKKQLMKSNSQVSAYKTLTRQQAEQLQLNKKYIKLLEKKKLSSK